MNSPEPETNPHEPDHSVDQTAVLRAIDANANRVAEALRAIEDVLRFEIEDRFLTQQTKNLRHQIATIILAAAPTSDRLGVRDTPHDLGTHIKADDEMSRLDFRSLVEANFQRAKQSLRSLEEHFKLRCQRTAAEMERLRYQSYTLEKQIADTWLGQTRMKHVTIYVLLDGDVDERVFEMRLQSLVQAGVDAVQLRSKRLDDRRLLQRCRQLVELVSGSRVLTFVNDRPDLARLSRASGVHLGQHDLPVHEARRILHPSQLIGVSTHSWEEAASAVQAGANYLGIGPVFPSRTKHFDQFVDAAMLRKICHEISLPVLAIGGISLANVAQVAACGASRIAVGAAMAESTTDLPATVKKFRQALSASECNGTA